jgi:hypothetical protein
MLPSIVKGAFIGLAAGLILVIVLGRFGMLRRRNRALNILTKFWYVYIPILLAVTLAALSGISYGHSWVLRLTNEARPEITEISVEAAEGFLESLGAVSGDIQVQHVITLFGGHIDGYFGTSVLQGITSRSGGYARRVVDAVRPYVTGALTDYVANRLLGAASGRLNLPEERVIELWNTDILTAFKSGLVIDIVEAQINARIAPAYKMVKTLFIILALIPAAEIGISLFLRRRSHAG